MSIYSKIVNDLTESLIYVKFYKLNKHSLRV